MILEKFVFAFAFNLREQNVTDFSFISLTQTFVLYLKITTVRHCFSTSYQRWFLRQWSFISGSSLILVPSLPFSPTKQPYSKVGNSRMYRYEIAIFNSNFYQKLKNKKWRYQFRVTKEFETKICVGISFKKIECLFLWRFEYR